MEDIKIDCGSLYYGLKSLNLLKSAVDDLSSQLDSISLDGSDLTKKSLLEESKTSISNIQKEELADLIEIFEETKQILEANDAEAALLFQYYEQGIIDEEGNFTDVPLLTQNDYPHIPYSKGSVASSGCGVTSLCMVASYLLGELYTPDDLAAYANKSAGDNVTRMTNAADYVGLNWYRDKNTSREDLYNYLKEGKLVICLVKGSSHFVVCKGIAENGDILINDPYRQYRKAGYEDGVTWDELRFSAGSTWIFDPAAQTNAKSCAGEVKVSPAIVEKLQSITPDGEYNETVTGEYKEQENKNESQNKEEAETTTEATTESKTEEKTESSSSTNDWASNNQQSNSSNSNNSGNNWYNNNSGNNNSGSNDNSGSNNSSDTSNNNTTEQPTEAVTEAPTEAVTEPVTEPQTEATTEAPATEDNLRKELDAIHEKYNKKPEPTQKDRYFTFGDQNGNNNQNTSSNQNPLPTPDMNDNNRGDSGYHKFPDQNAGDTVPSTPETPTLPNPGTTPSTPNKHEYHVFPDQDVTGSEPSTPSTPETPTLPNPGTTPSTPNKHEYHVFPDQDVTGSKPSTPETPTLPNPGTTPSTPNKHEYHVFPDQQDATSSQILEKPKPSIDTGYHVFPDQNSNPETPSGTTNNMTPNTKPNITTPSHNYPSMPDTKVDAIKEKVYIDPTIIGGTITTLSIGAFLATNKKKEKDSK